VKQFFSRGGNQWEGEGHKERVNEGEMYFVFISENRRIKPVRIVLRRGRRGKRGLTHLKYIVSTHVNNTTYPSVQLSYVN
jgi:hypothetical protein